MVGEYIMERKGVTRRRRRRKVNEDEAEVDVQSIVHGERINMGGENQRDSMIGQL